MSKKTRAALLLALAVEATSFTGCHTVIGSQIENSIKSAIGIDDTKQLNDIMEACETMATVQDSEVKDVCDKIRESIRKADSESYTSWTDPEGELHRSYYRDRQDVLDIIDIFSKNTWDISEEGKYIALEDVPENKFIWYNGELEIGDLKNFLLDETEDSINALLEENGAKFRLKRPEEDIDFGENPMSTLHGASFSLLNKRYNEGEEIQIYLELSDGEKAIYKKTNNLGDCIAKADTGEELVRAAINVLALDRAAHDEDFRTYIVINYLEQGKDDSDIEPEQ